MKEQKHNQQKGIIELLKFYPWITGVKITGLTGYAHPITVISRIRAKQGAGSIIQRPHVDKEGKVCNYNEYNLSEEFKAKMFPVKKPFPVWITQYK